MFGIMTKKLSRVSTLKIGGSAQNLKEGIQKGLLSLKSISEEYFEYMCGENVRPDVSSNLANFCEAHSL